MTINGDDSRLKVVHAHFSLEQCQNQHFFECGFCFNKIHYCLSNLLYVEDQGVYCGTVLPYNTSSSISACWKKCTCYNCHEPIWHPIRAVEVMHDHEMGHLIVGSKILMVEASLCSYFILALSKVDTMHPIYNFIHGGNFKKCIGSWILQWVVCTWHQLHE